MLTTTTAAVSSTADTQTITLRAITGDEAFTATRMTYPQLRQWRWVLHVLETEHVLCSKVSGWHPQGYLIADENGTHLGVVLIGGGRVHSEWYDPARDDYFYAGGGSRLAHGVNAIHGQRAWAARHAAYRTLAA
jgi:hypothetical protein